MSSSSLLLRGSTSRGGGGAALKYPIFGPFFLSLALESIIVPVLIAEHKKIYISKFNVGAFLFFFFFGLFFGSKKLIRTVYVIVFFF